LPDLSGEDARGTSRIEEAGGLNRVDWCARSSRVAMRGWSGRFTRGCRGLGDPGRRCRVTVLGGGRRTISLKWLKGRFWMRRKTFARLGWGRRVRGPLSGDPMVITAHSPPQLDHELETVVYRTTAEGYVIWLNRRLAEICGSQRGWSGGRRPDVGEEPLG